MTTDTHSLARSLRDRLQTTFDAVVDKAAQLCARNGKLDAAKLDEHQWISYELALASADLLAAKTAIAATQISRVDSALALAFATEAIGSLPGRLEGIFLECGLDPRELHALAASGAVAQLRKA